MPRPVIKDGLHDHLPGRGGMKEVRRWVYDKSDPEFMARLKRDMKVVRESEDEAEVMAFVAELADWPSYEE